MVTKKNICISCKKELKGTKLKTAKTVVDDHLIRTIRKIKKAFNAITNNKLYVCKEDLKEHKTKRKKFEKNFILTLVLAILIFLTLVILPLILGGAFNFGSVILGAVIAVLLTALMGFINYVPATKV